MPRNVSQAAHRLYHVSNSVGRYVIIALACYMHPNMIGEGEEAQAVAPMR
jgi:hypothetical protein